MRGGRGGTIAAGVAVALTAAPGCGRIDFDPGSTPPPTPTSYTGTWRELGGSATGGGITNLPAGVSPYTIRVGLAGGRPFVAWTAMITGDYDVYVRAWDGSTWADLGGSSTPGGMSGNTQYDRAGGIGGNPDGQPCVTWTVEETRELMFQCWSGSAWLGVDGSGLGIANGGDPWWPQVAFDGAAPIIAWEEYGTTANGSVYLRRADGAGWAELGGSASGTGVSGALDASATTVTAAGGEIWVVYQAADRSNIYAVVWDGTRWQGRAGSETGTGVSNATLPTVRPVVAIGDAPYVAWIDDADPNEVGRLYLRTWDGAAWAELGGSATGNGITALPPPVFYPTVAAGHDGEPIVLVRRGGDAHVARWDGTAWTEPGASGAGGASATGAADWPEMVVAPDGTIYVIWLETVAGGGGQLYLRYLSPDP